MEILQTIWNALTSENEILLNIVSIPMIFLEIGVAFLLFTQLLNITYTKKQCTIIRTNRMWKNTFSTNISKNPKSTFCYS